MVIDTFAAVDVVAASGMVIEVAPPHPDSVVIANNKITDNFDFIT